MTQSAFEADISWSVWGDPHRDEPAGGVVLRAAGDAATELVVEAVQTARLYGYKPFDPNGRALLVLAGGGYLNLVIGKEGVEVARWLASIGYHAFVLAHRFPNAATSPAAPLDDAAQAIRLIRSRADELGLTGVGVLGLSSGGHLAACLAADYPAEWKAPESPLSDLSAKPDVLLVGYGPISTNAKGRTLVADKPPLPPAEKQALYDRLQPDAQLADDPPPTFIVYAADDAVVPWQNGVRLYEAVMSKGGSAELHIFDHAPHGFALRTPELPVGAWPKLAEAWLKRVGFA